ncbi:MAG: sensor domain-containing diguanylate cyclase [Gammaproteobacteria bacterium]|nr:sensor domain-containing diguanylate cyclase [Gammaproteobacteria bacterium]NVK87244.1 sensor domain-containing diguanylate cyclase [Gammaproteobacteria bacterium]
MAIIEHYNQSRELALEHENRRLKSLLESLVDKAELNQKTFSKFQNLEFDLLHTAHLPLLLKKLTEDFKQRLDIEFLSLVLYDPYGIFSEILTSIYPNSNPQNVRFVKDHNFFETLYQNNYQPQIRQKNKALVHTLFAKDASVRSIMTLPLTRNNLVIGSYHLGSVNQQRFTPEMSTDFYAHFAQVVAICLENTANTEHLKHLSLIDPLTKTKNRRCLYQSLEKEIARADRNMVPLSCLFIDIDHFKQVNDQYGHAMGDQVLEHVAQVIQPNLRATDLLARFGGEEFTTILPNCDEQFALNISERIRQMIASQSFTTSDQKTFNITCSIGITTWSPARNATQKENLADAIINQADKALYTAKNNGRNQCVWRSFGAED